MSEPARLLIMGLTVEQGPARKGLLSGLDFRPTGGCAKRFSAARPDH